MKSLEGPTPSRPIRDPWLQLVATTHAALKLGQVAKADFYHAKEDLANNDCGYTRRNLVRCFGSLLDVLAAILREVSCEMGDVFEKPQNRFLREKSGARGTTASFRVKASYRLVAQMMPESPFARVDPSRWERLHCALEVRNRVLHPDTVSGMSVSDGELRLIVTTAAEFLDDLDAFFGLCQLHSQELFQATNGRRVRIFAKIRLTDHSLGSSGKEIEQTCTAPLAA
jgi:hypothetical protein